MDDPSGCFAAERVWAGAPLSTANLTLRRPDFSDITALVEHANDIRVAHPLPVFPHPYGLREGRAFLEMVNQGRRDGNNIIFALERRVTPGLIGCASLRRYPDMAAHQAALGYWLGAEQWNKGYATETALALCRLAFSKLGIRQLQARVLDDNPASQRVLEKVGFTPGSPGVCEAGRRPGAGLRHYALDITAWQQQQRQKPRVLVSAVALVDGDNRVLMAQRPAGKSLAGQWEFPGGKVDDGETPEAALVRELHEELGIDITASCLAPLAFASHDYDRFHLLMPLYICRVWRGTPVPREGQALKWLRPTKMLDLPLPPADVPLVALLRDFLA